MKNIVKILLVITAAIALASCSTFGSKTGSAGENGGANGGATTSGVAGQQQFGGNDMGSASYANKLKAPYNQVYRFDFNNDNVHQDDVASINVQANYLVAHPSARVRLDGNTDERGSREYNVALGWRRAKDIAALLKQQGVAPNQIVTNSYGEEKPVAFCHNESCYKLNRRVNLTYEAK